MNSIKYFNEIFSFVHLQLQLNRPLHRNQLQVIFMFIGINSLEIQLIKRKIVQANEILRTNENAVVLIYAIEPIHFIKNLSNFN